MQRTARKAFTALPKIGAPVIDHGDSNNQWGAHFIISADDNVDEVWADYYDGPMLERVDEKTGKIVWRFGVNPKITDILDECGLYDEWIDPGTIGVYDA